MTELFQRWNVEDDLKGVPNLTHRVRSHMAVSFPEPAFIHYANLVANSYTVRIELDFQDRALGAVEGH